MSSTMTKQALEEALKTCMRTKPLDKITIRDLTDGCGISRMAFYYHFKDIYDLIEWVCLADVSRALAGKKTLATWEQGLRQVFEAVYENKVIILNAYQSLSRERIEKFLFKLASDLIYGVVDTQAEKFAISDAHKRFIADFYQYSFVGIMLDWIKSGMHDDYDAIVNDVCTLMRGTIDSAIENFTHQGE